MRFALDCLAMTLVAASFSGCIGGGESATKASFLATPMNEDKSHYKFDASASTGEGLSFTWDFGDRTEPGTGAVAEHHYQYLNGMYSVTLTVTDASGANDSITERVQVGAGQNQVPYLYLKTDKRRALPNESVLFDASQSVDLDGDPLFFEWDFNSQLGDDEYDNMENLGWQQYGRYTGKPPPSGNATGGNNSGQGGGLTPSGHDWTREYEKAQKRLMELVGGGGFHGGEAGAAEPRNTDFDGNIGDESPIQLFAFPSSAVYYVHVKALDIKGDFQEGFIRISVEPNPPNATEVNTRSDRPLQAGVLPDGTPEQLRNFEFTSVNVHHPGLMEVWLNFTKDPNPQSPATAEMASYICGSGKNRADCKSTAAASLPSGPSGRSFSHYFAPDKTGGYQVLVENTKESPVKYTLTVILHNDLNPWALDESGLGTAHH